jgi:hypothetical protein
MSDEAVPPDERRGLAVELFNLAWELLETPDRISEQDDRMLHAAHASRFHWGEIGEPIVEDEDRQDFLADLATAPAPE